MAHDQLDVSLHGKLCISDVRWVTDSQMCTRLFAVG